MSKKKIDAITAAYLSGLQGGKVRPPSKEQWETLDKTDRRPAPQKGRMYEE